MFIFRLTENCNSEESPRVFETFDTGSRQGEKRVIKTFYQCG